MPGVFVSLAEESGLISEIGRWVFERACRDRHLWQNRRPTHEFALSVNVPGQQLLAPDYAATVAAVLSRTGTALGPRRRSGAPVRQWAHLTLTARAVVRSALFSTR